MRRFFVILLLTLLGCVTAAATDIFTNPPYTVADSVVFTVRFDHESSKLRTDRFSNAKVFNSFSKTYKNLSKDLSVTILDISVVGDASREGTLKLNKKLGLNRARKVKHYLTAMYGIDTAAVKLGVMPWLKVKSNSTRTNRPTVVDEENRRAVITIRYTRFVATRIPLPEIPVDNNWLCGGKLAPVKYQFGTPPAKLSLKRFARKSDIHAADTTSTVAIISAVDTTVVAASISEFDTTFAADTTSSAAATSLADTSSAAATSAVDIIAEAAPVSAADTAAIATPADTAAATALAAADTTATTAALESAEKRAHADTVCEAGYDFRIGTNLLYDAFTVANATVEVGIGRHMAFDVMATFSPWDIRDNYHYRTLLFQPELRYYLNKCHTRHYFGLEGHFGWYNIATKNSRTRYQDRDGSTPLWGAGLVYGYVLPFSRHCGMDFSVGLGYTKLDYDCFYNIENGAKYTATVKDFAGPTKLGVTFYYQF